MTLVSNLLRPIQAFRIAYLPLVMVYFAYGALGLIDVTRDLWIKEKSTLTASELAGIGVWLTLPWTVKMVFGELVDCVPIFGSRRRIYILIGAAFTAAGLIILAGAAGGWLTFARLGYLYLLGSLSIVLGTVIQDVVADAMTTEVVPRIDAAGKPMPEEHLRTELGLVQVIGRFSLSAGVLAVAGLSGYLAGALSRESVFLLGLAIPALSITGVLLIKSEIGEPRPIDWRILGGGIAFGTAVVALGLGGVPFAQEIIFVISMAVICTMLVLATSEISAENQRKILYTTIIIFAFRATPNVGDGYFWWTLDVLKFDAEFYGVLRQTGAVLSLIVLFLFAKQLAEYSAAKTLLALTILSTLLALPMVGLYYGLAEWTERMFGFGARSIALVDTAAVGPFAQLSMIPLLTLTAFYAPPGHRATWFALMASLMNMATVAGQLQTKYINQAFLVERGAYGELGLLVLTVLILDFLIPISAILLFGRRT